MMAAGGLFFEFEPIPGETGSGAERTDNRRVQSSHTIDEAALVCLPSATLSLSVWLMTWSSVRRKEGETLTVLTAEAAAADRVGKCSTAR